MCPFSNVYIYIYICYILPLVILVKVGQKNPKQTEKAGAEYKLSAKHLGFYHFPTWGTIRTPENENVLQKWNTDLQ